MIDVTGIFRSYDNAKRALERLRSIGIADENLSFLMPGASREEIRSEIPTSESEQPGMGKAIGGVVGVAVGTSAGSQLGMATASAFVPGVGWLVGAGLAAAAILGVGGAVGGAAVGGALENAGSHGLPRDELFVYEDALRKGRIVVFALAEDRRQAAEARKIFEESGAESVDAAREQWWIGLRDAEQERYRIAGGDFGRDEQEFRRGFEAALGAKTRGHRYEEMSEYLGERYPDLSRKESFRRGYEQGQDHYRRLRESSSGESAGAH